MEQIKQEKLLEIRDVIKTEESRINYLRGLIRIAESDKNKTSAEEGFIYKIAEIIGASYDEIWQAENEQESEYPLSIQFVTKQEKMLFLMQALYMCWLDDDYSDSEREEIVAIGDELGVDPSEIDSIESWIKRGIDWLRTGASLLGLE